jgi:hypothetical protein
MSRRFIAVRILKMVISAAFTHQALTKILSRAIKQLRKESRFCLMKRFLFLAGWQQNKKFGDNVWTREDDH